MSRISLAAVFCLVSAAVSQAAGPELDENGFKQHVVPFLQKHCVECHGPEASKGELKLHQVRLADLAAGDSLTMWTNVLERLATGNMPPADHPQPSRQESGRVVLWIRDQLLVVGHGAEFAFPNK